MQDSRIRDPASPTPSNAVKTAVKISGLRVVEDGAVLAQAWYLLGKTLIH
jgi:hypothetical protein